MSSEPRGRSRALLPQPAMGKIGRVSGHTEEVPAAADDSPVGSAGAPGIQPVESAQPPARRHRSTPVRLLRRWLRPLAHGLSHLAAVVVPYLYLFYMRVVWATSRIERHNFEALHEIIVTHNGAVGLLWHEEVMTVAFGYYYLGFRPHTLASLGDAGELIARMLALCGFVVFRGGTTTGRSRRREGVLQEMIDHMRTNDRVIYGLTVDGSKGPPYRMKTGGIVIARECGKPVVLARTWYKRSIRLPTWDRMAVPLPFNVIAYYLRGPYLVPAGAQTETGLEQFRLEMENELIDLAAQSYDEMGQARPANLLKRQNEREALGSREGR